MSVIRFQRYRDEDGYWFLECLEETGGQTFVIDAICMEMPENDGSITRKWEAALNVLAEKGKVDNSFEFTQFFND